MMAFFRDFRLIWRYAIQYRHSNRPSNQIGWIVWCIVILAVILLFMAINKGNWLGGAVSGLALCAMLISVYWWFRFFRGAIIYNIPACAMLVPRIRRRAIQATLLTWLLTATIVASYAVACTGCFSFGFGRSFVYASATLLIVGMFFTVANIPHWVLVTVIAVSYIDPLLPQGLQGVMTLFVYLPLMAAVGHHSIQGVFMRDLYQLLARRAFVFAEPPGAKQRKESSFAASVAGIASMRWIAVPQLYINALRRDCRPGAAKGNLALHVLGPECHWSRIPAKIQPWLPQRGMLVRQYLISLCFLLIAFVVFRVSLWWLGQKDIALAGAFAAISWVLIMPLILAGFFLEIKRFGEYMTNTRTEQALFRLTPCLPSAELNHHLRRQLMRTRLVDWACWALGLLLLNILCGSPALAMWFSLGLFSACLPLSSVIGMYYTKLSKPQLALSVVLNLLCVVLVLGALYEFVMMFVHIFRNSQSGSRLFFSMYFFDWQRGLHLSSTMAFILLIPGFVLFNFALTAILLVLRMHLLAKVPFAFIARRQTT